MAYNPDTDTTTPAAQNASAEESAIQRFRDHFASITGTHPTLEHIAAFWAGLHAHTNDAPPLPASVDPRPQPPTQAQ